MSVKFEFDFESFEEMRTRIESIDSDIETELNQILKDEGKKTIEPSITALIPISAKRRGAHAKNSKWSTQDLGNLEITIKAKGGAANKPGSFGYLVFPNEGRGPRNHVAHHFMETGRDLALPNLVEVTQQKLIERIEEVL
ncbi:hypothetical protein QT711_03355 [Sporosarcina saromensis]|uniref:Bacteriophage HK97-gp10, tail-component n=1 Tax=Sporosarcina saromensis TaxID=359365 RepID=A0ABU4G9F0_9BACL|nr:hypothetical protein [Sporosarcina saromensis]MDW0112207.1 hypothetical protein [Sporosarcina saromensis]